MPTKYPQSAVVPFMKNERGDLLVVLVTSMSTGEWTIPKGIIEEGMSAEESACKEAEEEAGIFGNIVGDSLCEFEYKKWGGICHVQVFALKVSRMSEEWDECDVRKRKVFPIGEGIKVIRADQVGSLEALKKRFHKL